jgi:D-alanyl-D-alanine carboxypeptidase
VHALLDGDEEDRIHRPCGNAVGDAKGAILRVDVPATSKMHFRVGAMAIPFLTTIALQLQDQRRLDLDDKLSRWYPSYPDADRVTLRMLASGTSGYPDQIQENPVFQALQLADVFRDWNDDELLRYAFALPPVCDPGTCFHYAHSGFIVLARVLEKVTRQSMTTLMLTRFLRPLGMSDTRISKLPSMPQPVLHAHSTEREVYEDSTYWSPSWSIGRGVAMTSTARDMIKGIRAVGTGKFVSRSGLRQLFTPYSRGLPGAPPFDYSLGGLATSRSWSRTPTDRRRRTGRVPAARSGRRSRPI